MSAVPTELPRISDAAARHTVDAAKAFKEFLRVREALKEFEGSMHWKKVDQYEYLVHKRKGGKQVYLGARAPETQAKLDAFSAAKRKLETRLKTLKETVETSQRVNKAVRAGSVPPPVVEVLRALDDAGLGKGSLVVGSTALYAYGQHSGLRVDAIKAPGEETSVAEEQQHHLLVLIDASPIAALNKVRHAVKTAEITPLALPSCHNKMALDVSYGCMSGKGTSGRELSVHAHWTSGSWIAKSLLMPKCQQAVAQSRPDDAVFDLLEQIPRFEQVVIGRTGRMAMMRTLDPLVFVSLCERRPQDADMSPDDEGRRKLQLELVSRMLDDFLVTSKIEEGSGQQSLARLQRALGSSQSVRPTPAEQTAQKSRER